MKSVIKSNAKTSLTTSRHDLEVFCKKVFVKVSQNSQENSCAEVSFACNFNKNGSLELVVSYYFCEIALLRQSAKGKCVQIFPRKVFICFEYIQIK